ncbi:F-box only protein 4-like isoform X1 [Crassostrea virginica]
MLRKMASDILPIVNPSLQVKTQVFGETLHTLRTLIRKYKEQIGGVDDVCVISGGLQQYLIKKDYNMRRVEESVDTNNDRRTSITFSDLPVNAKLNIFSTLDAIQLCKIARVNKEWYNLTSDNILWSGLLQRDICNWNMISHRTNPGLYKEAESEWSNKEIYLHCSPQTSHLMHEENSLFRSFTSMIRSFLPKKTPKIAMFGPGLESGTLKIVPLILNNSDMLKTVGVAPGEFSGVGAGFYLKIPKGQIFQLSVLYSASSKVRKTRRKRLENNNLLELVSNEDGEQVVELKPAVRACCCAMDAFIYVVDSTIGRDFEKEDYDELMAVVNERWSAPHVPLLILSCTPTNQQQRIPCVNVVEALKLSSLNRPWQVHDVDVDTLNGVIPSIEWLIEQSQRQ